MNASARDEDEVVEQVVALTLQPRNMDTVFARRRLMRVVPTAPGRAAYTVETIEIPDSSEDEAEDRISALARRLTGERHCFNPDTEDLLALLSHAYPDLPPRVFNWVAARCRTEGHTTIGSYAVCRLVSPPPFFSRCRCLPYPAYRSRPFPWPLPPS